MGSPTSNPNRPQIELWQAEWCPWSHHVRQRLTELGLSYVVHQVPAARSERAELMGITGQDHIPAIRFGGAVISGTEAILALLDREFVEPLTASAHRAKATEKAAERLREAA